MNFLLAERTYVPEFNKLPKFSYAHFHTPLSKHPIATLGTIFFPLWLLGVINLAVFYQDAGLADRIANIATLMIAFVGIIPMIREEVPPNPKFTAIEMLVYLQIATTLLCLISSFLIRSTTRGDESTLDPLNDPFFLISLGINIAQFVIPVICYIWYLVRVVPKNHRKSKSSHIIEKDYSKWCENRKANEKIALYFHFNKKSIFVEGTRNYRMAV